MNRVGWMLATLVAFNGMSEPASGQSPVSPSDLGGDRATVAARSSSAQALLAEEGAPTSPAPEPAPAAEEAAPEGPKPFAIRQPCFFQEHGIKWGGWVQQGITFNSWGRGDGFNGPIATNDRVNEYMLNQAWLYFVRPTKTDGCGFDIGGRVDVVYGEDWRFGQCVGLEDRINDADAFYGWVLPQFYVEVAYNNLTVKIGHFATLTSLELVPAPLNFFYSHSYLMTGYFDPLLVTGLQADYKLNDNWTLVGGFNRGWQLYENPFEPNALDFLGGLKWASDDKRTAMSVMIATGPTQTFAAYHEVTNVITVLTHQFSERFFSGTQITVGGESNGSVVNPGQNDAWYGFEQLFTYKFNPKWSAAARYEWVQDNGGSRIAGIGNILGTDKGWQGAPGFAGSFSDLSFGLNYRPHPNFVLRPEVRWDWYHGAPNGNAELPFGNLLHSSQFTTGLDLLFTF